jgi:hypothetical protein
MDFLSVASNAANLLSATIQVMRTTYTYGAGIKSLNEDVTKLTNELQSLRKPLEDLEKLGLRLASNKDSPEPSDSSEELISTFDLCFTLLQALLRKLSLEETPNTHFRDVWRPFRPERGGTSSRERWPISKVDTVQMVTKFRAIKGVIGSYISSNEM